MKHKTQCIFSFDLVSLSQKYKTVNQEALIGNVHLNQIVLELVMASHNTENLGHPGDM